MNKILVVFDDTVHKSEVIADVIGSKGFADVVVKKRKLEERYRSAVESFFPAIEWKVIRSPFEFNEFLLHLESLNDNVRVLHCFTNYAITDAEKVGLTCKKLLYIDRAYVLTLGSNPAALIFPDLTAYRNYLRQVCKNADSVQCSKELPERIALDGIINIGIVGNFIQYVTGSFDSRYFNSLRGNEYTIVKRSTDKRKIKAEYTYYHLLPEDMQPWFVLPYNYQETENDASYTMERLHMTDLAIKWVHGSIDDDEFKDILDMYFHFFSERHSKAVSSEEYRQIADALYVKKVCDRVAALKKLPAFAQLGALLADSGISGGMDGLVERYLALKEKIESAVHVRPVSVIGHGDPCFSNALYNKSTRMLKFIDPRGALQESELWTNPYYDLAKLSHSICGRYDFFNNGLYDIELDSQLRLCLRIDFDNSRYKELFHQQVEANGYDYRLVRLYEVSLFLSMLPLHMDNPHKVLGFILNAAEMLKELDGNVA